MLKIIAETTQGQYYHVASDERIAAFGNCIGGLVSVVAQNVTLTLTHGAHATVAKVHGSYPTTVDPATHNDRGRPRRPLRRGEEEPSPRPHAAAARDARRQRGRCQGVAHVLRRAGVSQRHADDDVWIARPAETPMDQKVNVEIDEQINRLRLADAMQEATRVGDAGVAQGQKVVRTPSPPSS